MQKRPTRRFGPGSIELLVRHDAFAAEAPDVFDMALRLVVLPVPVENKDALAARTLEVLPLRSDSLQRHGVTPQEGASETVLRGSYIQRPLPYIVKVSAPVDKKEAARYTTHIARVAFDAFTIHVHREETMSPHTVVSLAVIIAGTMVLFGGWLMSTKKAVPTREIVLPLLVALGVSTAARLWFVPKTLEWNIETFYAIFYFTTSALFVLIVRWERQEAKFSDSIISLFIAVLLFFIGVYSLTTTKL